MIIILHGYSDVPETFKPLAEFLQQNGFSVRPIYLADYITLEDEITIPDLAETFEKRLNSLGIAREEKSFDLIVHSTGALVAREWLTQFYLETGRPCPVDHFLMLAPANFGSPLGAVGKTMLGRIIKGWATNFESGTQVLTSLEMASSYTRSLALRDVLVDNTFYKPEVCKTAILVGSHPYGEGLRKLVDKNGGDGTVYVCTANLNTSYLRIVLGKAGETPSIVETHEQNGIAFGVLPNRNHATITDPSQVKDELGGLIIRFLGVASGADYAAFATTCTSLTQTTLPDAPTQDIYHTYMNLAPRVLDNLRFSVSDYFLEFYERAKDGVDPMEIDSLMVQVHSDIIEEVHNFSRDASYRSLIFDLTDLKKLLSGNQQLVFSLSAAPLSPLIGYSCDQKNDVGEFPLGPSDPRFWRPNQTLLVDLIVERRQGKNDGSPQPFDLVRF